MNRNGAMVESRGLFEQIHRFFLTPVREVIEEHLKCRINLVMRQAEI